MADFKVIWSDRALVSLKQIHDFIALENPKGAKKIAKSLLESAGTLAFFPSRNPFEPLLRDEPIVYRFLVKGNYKIIYFVDNEEVVIVLVFDTRKRPNKLLSGD